MPNIQSAAEVPAATGAEPFLQALVAAGNTEGTCVLKKAPIDKAGELNVLDLASGNTVLTLAMTLYDVIRASSPTNTTLEVPSEVSMGYTRVTGKELSFNVMRDGDGLFAVNFTGGSVAAANGIDYANFPKWSQITNFRTSGANSWVVG